MIEFIVDLAYSVELTQSQIQANQEHLDRLLPIYQKLHELETVTAKNLSHDEHELVNMEWFDAIRASFEDQFPEPHSSIMMFNLVNFYEDKIELLVEEPNNIYWKTYYYGNGNAGFYRELIESHINALVPGKQYWLQTTNGKRLTLDQVSHMIANKDLQLAAELLQ
jgi:hypothetical protein